MDELFGTGMLPQPEDSRDALYGAFEEVLGAYPAEWSLARLPFVRNQGSQFSCVKQTTARISDYANRKEGDTSRTSAQYGFAYCKMWDGQPTLQGTFTKTGLKVFLEKGLSTKWPDNASLPYEEYIAPPTAEADTFAKPFRISGYVALTTHAEIRDYLTKYELPVMMGINSNNSGWGRTVVKNNGYVLKEPTGGRTGHLVACVGWNDKGWIFDNSWGESWGDKGRATVPYEYSGLQKTMYGVYDLPNDWKEINQTYIMDRDYARMNGIVYGLYMMARGAYPSPEEAEAVRGHVEAFLEADRIGGEKGQAIINQVYKSFGEEMEARFKAKYNIT